MPVDFPPRFYATYEEAVCKIFEIHQLPSSLYEGNQYSSPCPAVYTYKSLLSLLWSMFQISLAVLVPYLMIVGFVVTVLLLTTTEWLLFLHISDYAPPILIISIMLIVLLTKMSDINSTDSPQKPDGSVITAGLYFRREERSSSGQLVYASSLLNLPCVIRSGLPGLPRTPWMLSGDLRTLFPYAFFRPADVRTRYIRRWVRVRLADNDPIREEALKEANVCFEAVAVDHAPATSPDKIPGAAVQALLVLAGLTGGSSEGYVMDLVQHANAQGFDCFVMIGRGLAGCPLSSGVPFHGARTEDVVTVGQVIRASLPPGSKLFAVGLSLGGIIVSSAMAKGPRQPDLPRLAQFVDGAVSISGCFDSMSNVAFRHSREVWQPMLAHGLKEAIVANDLYSAAIARAFGQDGEDAHATCDRVTSITEKISSVLDFDSIMVTRLNGFRSVAEYYRHLTATDDQILSSPHNNINNHNNNHCQGGGGGGNLTLEKPLLALHAMDDVIVHPNTMPSAACSSAVDNLICLVTTTGGHVGWPVGLFPTKHRWLFQNSIVIDFCRTLCALQR